jgi:hypothetical protein
MKNNQERIFTAEAQSRGENRIKVKIGERGEGRAR